MPTSSWRISSQKWESLKTSHEPPARVNLVGMGRITAERIRASLSRSPFLFLDTAEPLPAFEVDLYVIPADTAADMLAARGAPPLAVPVIAYGPATLLRSAFLCGCADYLRDPWHPDELGMRALAVLQRMKRRWTFPWGELSLQGTELDTPAGGVTLTVHESRILRALLMSRGTPVPRQALSYLLWGRPGPAGSRVLDVHVAAIRKKVAAAVPAAGRFIRAVRREGYLIP
jgi:hypothetical protein